MYVQYISLQFTRTLIFMRNLLDLLLQIKFSLLSRNYIQCILFNKFIILIFFCDIDVRIYTCSCRSFYSSSASLLINIMCQQFVSRSSHAPYSECIYIFPVVSSFTFIAIFSLYDVLVFAQNIHTYTQTQS